jgi:hypothetical protein
MIGVVSNDERFEQGSGNAFFFRVESLRRFKLKAQIVIRPAFLFIENQSVGGYAEGDGELLDHV